jgi:lia operon protein LiaH
MYKAKQSVGEFLPGQEVTGLEDSDIERLLSIGAIEEVDDEPAKSAEKAPAKSAKK